ncbi:hypothetical protein ACFQZ0_02235 [Streptomyces erythrogriseus]
MRRLLTAVDARPGPDTTFALCGPPGLVTTARRVLADSGADPSLVRWELFTADGTQPTPPERTGRAPGAGSTGSPPCSTGAAGPPPCCRTTRPCSTH